ncbi:MAG: hypothetical protein K2H47_12875 [Muribaculaceae bacterium]|nr:hypothetical protein [Muribaculaceae bacterium]
MDILEAIRERRSVRSFDGAALSEAVRKDLLAFAEKVYNPFGGHFSIRLKSFNLENGYKPTTYGMIKDAHDFFLIGMADDETSALATGFCFEQVVLKAWQLGLGTCWIAATFKGTDFDNGESWPKGEALKIISPVGKAAKKSLMEKITRLSLGSRNRKPFSELFFTDGFKQPLSSDSPFDEALEMLRLAPSSTNSQPWRVLIDNDTVHFYYVLKSRLSVLDTGIGICHFYETEKYYGHTGAFYTLPTPPANHDKWKYLISYKREDQK